MCSTGMPLLGHQQRLVFRDLGNIALICPLSDQEVNQRSFVVSVVEEPSPLLSILPTGNIFVLQSVASVWIWDRVGGKDCPSTPTTW